MSLREHGWAGYYPGGHDHLREIFLPALKRSVQYDRITGAFSASVLALFAVGLRPFLENGGQIRLLTGVELYDSDVDAIRRGESESVLEERIDWEQLSRGYPDAVLGALAWLIAEERLEIRIGTVTDERGEPLPRESAEWHQKEALFTDSEGESIGFVGSPNESFKALRRNRESINLNRSWISNSGQDWDEASKIEEQRAEFDRLWHDREDGARIFRFPDALKDKILQLKPRHPPDWEELAKVVQGEKGSLPEPREYQREAISRLRSCDGRIILQHATGTGKTWTALFAVKEIADSTDVIVVLVPRTDLITQWAPPRKRKNIKLFFPSSEVIRCAGGEDWRRPLYNALSADRDFPLFVVSTMHPSTLRDVFRLIGDETSPSHRIVVVDEAHNIGTPTRRRMLSEFDAAKARIALSATPFRGDAGDELLRSYFGQCVDTISLNDAIYKFGVLSRYSYHLHGVPMNEAERHDYGHLSDEIWRLYHRYKQEDDEPLLFVADRHGDLQARIQERANVHKECEAKGVVTGRILDSVGTKTLVFCNTIAHARRVKDQVDGASSRKIGLYHSEYTPAKRAQFLELFEDGTFDTLVSIDCLTEGVNIPACDSAVLISNSTSEREAVQRRGRVLRKARSSSAAEIHDFVVLPVVEEQFLDGSADLTEDERRMVLRELERVERMMEAAENRLGCRTWILKMRKAARRY